MKTVRILTFIAIIAFPFLATAQGIQTIKENLAKPDSVYGARTNVQEKGATQMLVRNLETPRPDQVVKGYRVCIFTEKSQRARENAFATEAKFKESYPNIATYVIYDKSANWKVMTGNCLTLDEVIILQGKAEKLFPGTPYIVNENIQVSEFGKHGSTIASTEYLSRKRAIEPEQPRQ